MAPLQIFCVHIREEWNFSSKVWTQKLGFTLLNAVESVFFLDAVNLPAKKYQSVNHVAHRRNRRKIPTDFTT